MNRAISPVLWGLGFVLLAGGSGRAAETPVAGQLPAGTWRCGVGSYALRDCRVVQEGEQTFLEIPDGLGHWMPMRGELLPTDTPGEVLFDGQMMGRFADCDDDCDDASRHADADACRKWTTTCRAQPLRVLLQKKADGSWRGTLTYLVVRGRYNGLVAERYYRVGAHQAFRIAPPKGGPPK